MLIGLAGVAGSGKDTVGDHLGVKTYAFAQPMKEACRLIFNWTDEHLHGSLKEAIDPKYGISPRQAFQTIGTEWGRNLINQNIWLIRAEQEIDKHNDLVITDVRFDNEAQLIRRNGGIVINIIRPDINGVNPHVSENSLSPNQIDHHIVNDGTLWELYRKVDTLLNVIAS